MQQQHLGLNKDSVLIFGVVSHSMPWAWMHTDSLRDDDADGTVSSDSHCFHWQPCISRLNMAFRHDNLIIWHFLAFSGLAVWYRLFQSDVFSRRFGRACIDFQVGTDRMANENCCLSSLRRFSICICIGHEITLEANTRKYVTARRCRPSYRAMDTMSVDVQLTKEWKNVGLLTRDVDFLPNLVGSTPILPLFSSLSSPPSSSLPFSYTSLSSPFSLQISHSLFFHP